jgi:hypothetical protein
MTTAKRPARATTSASKTSGRRSPVTAAPPTDSSHPLPHDELYARILRYVRRFPNRAIDLTPLAAELGMPPFALQVEVERLGQRGLLNLPFIEPGTGGGAELTQKGAAWLIAHEGGRPKDVPTALKIATGRVRAEEEAARLPRAEVYGPGR